MARLAPEQRYPTDLTDAQWPLVKPLLTTHTGPGAPTRVDLRQMVNGILYLTRSGCQWRMIPLDYGYWGTVRYYYDKWIADGTWVRANDALRERTRLAAGRDPQPSAGILDSQSVKHAHVGGDYGFDAHKKTTAANLAGVVPAPAWRGSPEDHGGSATEHGERRGGASTRGAACASGADRSGEGPSC